MAPRHEASYICPGGRQRRLLKLVRVHENLRGKGYARPRSIDTTLPIIALNPIQNRKLPPQHKRGMADRRRQMLRPYHRRSFVDPR